jgi:1,4-dihydroxy-2-naphthoyl-CoA hydrolase
MGLFLTLRSRPIRRHRAIRATSGGQNCSVRAPVNPQVESYPVAGTLDDVLGFELIEAAPERCLARFAAQPRVQQPMGLVHGGAYAALAESMVSLTTHAAVKENGSVAVGQSNHTTFLRSITSGHVNAEGTPLHRGRTTWVWDVTFTDDDGRVCAVTRMTIAVRSAER